MQTPSLKNSYTRYSLIAMSAAAVLAGGTGAHAASDAKMVSSADGIDFNLTPSEVPSNDTAAASDDLSVFEANKPLSVPSTGTAPPVGKADGANAVTELPPPPPVDERIAAAPAPAPVAATPERSHPAAPSEPKQRPLILQFDLGLGRSGDRPAKSAPAPAPAPDAALPADLAKLFQGGTNSLVARAIGSAEGTRTPDGGKTSAFQGHVDPGNGVWNLGTFSYQHGAASPEEADQKQLARLQTQAQTLHSQAVAKQVPWGLEEQLNALDLANQSPRAALSEGGYIDRLKQAHTMGMRGSEAILWARVRSYLDPNTQRWNAPGLGNTVEGITADQSRRQQAIARAIEAAQTAPKQQLNDAPVATFPWLFGRP